MINNELFLSNTDENFREMRKKLNELQRERTSQQRAAKDTAQTSFGDIIRSIHDQLEALEQNFYDTNIIFSTAIEHNTELENQLYFEQYSPQWRHHEMVNRFSREWLCLIDRNYCYSALNHRFLKAHKKSRDELLGKSLNEFWDDTLFLKKLKPSIDQSFKGLDSKKRLRCTLPGTGEIYLECAFFPYRHPETEQITHVMMYAIDISSRIIAEDLIRQQNTFLDKIKDAIMILNHEGFITYWNKGCEALYGWSEEEAIGKEARSFLFRTTNRSQYQVAENLFFQNEEWSGEFQQVTKLKKTVYTESRWHPYKNPRTSELAILMINSDISSQKQIQEQFYRSQRVQSIGELTSGIAHDLNNVLASFFLAVKALRPRMENHQDQFIISMLENNANRGVKLVRQILSFAKGIDELQEIKVEPLCQELSEFIHDTFPKSIVLETDLPPQLWKIFGNPTQIYQVLLNLCVNARDAMQKKNGTLKLTFRNLDASTEHPFGKETIPYGHYLHISIQDSGVGIFKKDLDNIFKPFFTTKGKGTGLGLSTVKSIIVNHGGHVHVESKRNFGTTFHVFLPCLTEEFVS